MFEPLMQIVPLALLRRTRYHVGIDWLPDAIIHTHTHTRARARAHTQTPHHPPPPFLTPTLSVWLGACVGKKRKAKIPGNAGMEKDYFFL